MILTRSTFLPMLVIHSAPGLQAAVRIVKKCSLPEPAIVANPVVIPELLVDPIIPQDHLDLPEEDGEVLDVEEPYLDLFYPGMNFC